MPISLRRPWLICYDISDPRRLGRVYRYLRRHATPIQYSVFLARVNRKELDNVMGGIAARIDPGSDDVRAYPLMTGAPPFSYGRQLLPDGVLMFEDNLDQLSRAVA